MANKITPQNISKENIDVANGIIKCIVIATKGTDLNGDTFDDTSLQQFVALGNANPDGIKCGYGHPDLLSTTSVPDRYLGKYKNFRISGDKVLADLYLDAVAKSTPGKGDIYNYVLNLAQTAPDVFGNSVHYDPDAKQNNCERLKAFRGSDLVDAPAATESLFKSDGNVDENKLFEAMLQNPDLENKFSKYKAMKKSEVNTGIISDAKKLLASLKSIITGGQLKSVNHDLKEGGTMVCEDADQDGAADVGDEATIDGKPAKDGSYPTKDGKTISTGGGKINKIEDTDDSAAGDADDEMDAADEEIIKTQVPNALKSINNIKAKLKAQKTELETLKTDNADKENVIAAYETQLKSITAEITEIKSKIGSNYVPPARVDSKAQGTTVAKDAPFSEKFKAAKARKEQIELAKKESKTANKK